MKSIFRVVTIIVLAAALIGWLISLIAPTDAVASMAYQRGEQNKAAAGFIEMAVREPEAPARVYNAGSATLGLDDEEAAALLERAYELGEIEDKKRAAYNAGIAYYNARDYFAAVDAFRAVLTLDPDDADARYNYELALRLALPSTPSEQQQQTEPELGETDPTVTPSPEPGGFEGPTPTPPREEFEPDLTETPVGGTGDFGDDADSTPVPVEHGPMTLEQAMRLLDAAAQDALTIAPFYATPVPGGTTGENDW
jgi:Ca-activated chloride channel homolog